MLIGHVRQAKEQRDIGEQVLAGFHSSHVNRPSIAPMQD